MPPTPFLCTTPTSVVFRLSTFDPTTKVNGSFEGFGATIVDLRAPRAQWCMDRPTLGPCRPFFRLPPRKQRQAKPKPPSTPAADHGPALEVLRGLLSSSQKPQLPSNASLMLAISEGTPLLGALS